MVRYDRSVDNYNTTYVEVITNDQHWCVTASTLALDLNDGELAVCCRLTGLNSAEVLADGVQDIGRTLEHARRSSADLDKVLTNRLPKTTC